MKGLSAMRDRSKVIALNDQLRTMFRGGRVQMTPAVYALDPQLRGRALCALSRYNKFGRDDEHEYGVFIFAGYSFEWQIDYRSPDGSGVSLDPADASCTFRVLTLSLARDCLVPANGDNRRAVGRAAVSSGQ